MRRLNFLDLKDRFFPTYNTQEVIRLVLMLESMKKRSLSIEDLIDAYHRYQDGQRQQTQSPPPPMCPRCGNPLFVMPITKPKGKGNVKGWRSYVCCSSDACLFEKFYRKPVAELVREIMRRRAKGLKEVEDGNC